MSMHGGPERLLCQRPADAGASGEVEWSLLGTMLPGVTGTVSVDVLVE